MQTWFYRLPATARALITGALSAAAIFGVMSLYTVTAPWGDTRESVVVRLVVSTIAGMLTGIVGVALGDQRMHRIYGSTEQAVRYSLALRTGELPTEIAPLAWQGWLTASRQSNRWAPTAVGMFLLLAVLQSLDHRWAMAAMFVVFAMWQSVVAFVLRRRIARLEAAVGQCVGAQG